MSISIKKRLGRECAGTLCAQGLRLGKRPTATGQGLGGLGQVSGVYWREEGETWRVVLVRSGSNPCSPYLRRLTQELPLSHSRPRFPVRAAPQFYPSRPGLFRLKPFRVLGPSGICSRSGSPDRLG